MCDVLHSLAGQVAVITGAGRGLDAAVENIRAQGSAAFALPMDVTAAQAVREGFAQIVRQFGAIDLLVNNAGNMDSLGNTREVERIEWWQTIETHLLGRFLSSQEAMRPMARATYSAFDY